MLYLFKAPNADIYQARASLHPSRNFPACGGGKDPEDYSAAGLQPRAVKFPAAFLTGFDEIGLLGIKREGEALEKVRAGSPCPRAVFDGQQVTRARLVG